MLTWRKKYTWNSRKDLSQKVGRVWSTGCGGRVFMGWSRRPDNGTWSSTSLCSNMVIADVIWTTVCMWEPWVMVAGTIILALYVDDMLIISRAVICKQSKSWKKIWQSLSLWKIWGLQSGFLVREYQEIGKQRHSLFLKKRGLAWTKLNQSLHPWQVISDWPRPCVRGHRRRKRRWVLSLMLQSDHWCMLWSGQGQILQAGSWRTQERNIGQAVKWILRYLRGTSNFVLCFMGTNNALQGYADSDIGRWQGHPQINHHWICVYCGWHNSREAVS